ncbi:putative bifunctional diguanylate cyclase/phosphodiesterase [Caldimonas aquatica]|uniref:EAL domain-containing protein n=1 Tax=Caldimonas aquatica TaxID=376175 RepID=A0ABY6MQW2_9BURK|nr:GGDEF domain-containing phosphodiesterase [Schlegelella aquatica]UZD54378.1 EAL domain-containing protein [Schlegelella aquatica]
MKPSLDRDQGGRERHDPLLALHERVHLLLQVFNGTREGVLITDSHSRVLEVNDAFVEITGYARDAVLGQTPSLLSSGRHDPSFYSQMWKSLKETGRWQGEIWNRRASGEVYAEWLRILSVAGDDGQPTHYIGIFSDITAQKRDQELLDRLAHYDALTGLPNRRLMGERLATVMERARRHGQKVAVCVFDLDGFHEINGRFGHEAGDRCLVQLADRMQGVLRTGDTLARIGGDEFALLLGEVKGRADVDTVLRRVVSTLAPPYPLPEPLALSVSIGVSLYPDDTSSPDHLFVLANEAMHRARQRGGSRTAYAADADELVVHDDQTAALQAALVGGQLRLYFQPKVRAADGRLDGAEVLLRWHHPEHGVLLPGQFLPAVEGTPLQVDLDLWVLRTAARQLAAWESAGVDLTVCVNVSAATLGRTGFPAVLSQALAEAGVQCASRLELEVLESEALADLATSADVMQACVRLGIGFALDDFGTGYSSLLYLRRLPVRTLKIDRSFVRRMLDDDGDRHIVRAVVALAHAFGVTTVAEGVETEAIGSALRELGCDLLQGYAIARPMPAEDFERWIACRNRAGSA